MLSAYHVTGIIQGSFFLFSISAVYLQLQHVRERRTRLASAGNERVVATDNLSIVAMIGSFLAFYSFLLLSTATQPFAHYIFWSRIPACILAVAMLWEFRRDYPSHPQGLLGPLSALLLFSALIWTATAPGSSRMLIDVLQVFVLSAGVLLVGGQLHQLWLLLTRRRVGALSLRARTINLLKDLSTVAFGIALGADQSWSLIVVAGANAFVTSLVIGVGSHLFKYNKDYELSN